jgi:hypothetical protein
MASTGPTVYRNGVMLPGTDVTVSTPPDWATYTGTPTYLRQLAGGGSVFQSPVQLGVGTLTAAEALAWAQTGMPPLWWIIGTGNVLTRVPTGRSYSLGAGDADNSTGITSAIGGTYTRVAGARTGGAGGWYGLQTAAGGAQSGVRFATDITPVMGTAYLVRGWFFRSGDGILLNLRDSNGSGSGTVISTEQSLNTIVPDGGVWTFAEKIFVVTTAVPNPGPICVFIRNAASNAALGSTYAVDDLEVIPLGPVAKPVVQGVLYLADNGSNKLMGTIVGGLPTADAPPGTRAVIQGKYLHSEISTSNGTTLAFSLPAGWAVKEFACYVNAALDTAATISVGSLSTPTRWVNALLVDTIGYKQAASAQLVPQSISAATSVYIKKSGATTVGDIIDVVFFLERIS